MVSGVQFKEEIILGMRAQGVEETDKNIKKVEKTLDELTGASQRNARQIKTNMLGMGLSFLFTGMAIKRFADNMLKALVTTYSTVMGEGSAFQEQTNRLSAAFEFLKFSIFDALANSEFFANLVDWLVQAVNRISEFVAQHPALAKFIVTFLAIASVVGGLMMLFGQATLGLLGFMALGNLFPGFSTAWAAMTAKMAIAWKWFTGLTGPAALGMAFLLASIFVWIFSRWANTLGGMANFTAVIVGGIIETFGLLGGAIILTFQNAINFIIKMINNLISTFNTVSGALGGPTISLIKEVSFAGAGLGLAEMINQAMASGEWGSWLQGGLSGLTAAQGEFGGFGWLGQNQAPGNSSTQNNEFNITINGLTEGNSQDLIDDLMARLEETQALQGGAPQS